MIPFILNCIYKKKYHTVGYVQKLFRTRHIHTQQVPLEVVTYNLYLFEMFKYYIMSTSYFSIQNFVLHFHKVFIFTHLKIIFQLQYVNCNWKISLKRCKKYNEILYKNAKHKILVCKYKCIPLYVNLVVSCSSYFCLN